MKSIATGLLLAVLSTAAQAQTFPSRPVTIVVPSAAGAGAHELIARYLSEELPKVWNQPVTVEFRPGAGGSIGANSVSRATPDGHTIMVFSGAYTGNAAVQKSLPYDPVKDLKAIAIPGQGSVVIALGNQVKAKTISDLIAESKSRQMLWGSSGIGSTPDFATRILLDSIGADLRRVPYKGGGEILRDMLGERIDLWIGAASSIQPSASQGTLRAFAVVGNRRLKSMPDVPTLEELGVKNVDVSLWWAVFVPSATPASVITKINTDVNATFASAAGEAFMVEKMDAVPLKMTPEQSSAFVLDELARLKEVAVKYKLVLD